MTVASSLLKKRRFVILGVLICVIVVVHLEMRLTFLDENNTNDIKMLSLLEDKMDKLKRFSLEDKEISKKVT